MTMVGSRMADAGSRIRVEDVAAKLGEEAAQAELKAMQSMAERAISKNSRAQARYLHAIGGRSR